MAVFVDISVVLSRSENHFALMKNCITIFLKMLFLPFVFHRFFCSFLVLFCVILLYLTTFLILELNNIYAKNINFRCNFLKWRKWLIVPKKMMFARNSELRVISGVIDCLLREINKLDVLKSYITIPYSSSWFSVFTEL